MGKYMEQKLKSLAIVAVLTGPICHIVLSGFFTATWMSLSFTILGVLVLIGVLGLIVSMMFWRISMLQPANSHSLKSVVIQYVITSFMCIVGKKYLHKFIAFTKDVGVHQENLLLDILSHNSTTEYGRRYRFHNISTRHDYVRKVPLIKYQDIEKYIHKITSGKNQILCEDEVVYLAETSGTTGKSKAIPITGDMKGPSGMKMGPLMYHFMHTKAELNLQRVFILSYSAKVKKESCGLERGPVSAHMSRYLPFCTAPPEVYRLKNEQVALHVHAIFALKERELGHIETLFTTLVYSFWVYVEEHWEDICEDIENGYITISKIVTLDEWHHIDKLQCYIKPDSIRANELKREFSLGFHNIAKRVWPQLRFARMLSTGGFALHGKILENHYMCGVKQLSMLHVASEGFMGFNLSSDPRANQYTAMIDYGFLEFIPEKEIESDYPKTLFTEQLEKEESYEVVITSPMGLYRYRTGDVVKVMDFLNQCPIYEFQYRIGQLLNLYWEKTSEVVLYTAVENVICRLPQVTLVDYTATEDVHMKDIFDSRSSIKRYVLFIEVRGEDDEVGVPHLTNDELDLFDKELCNVFEMYKRFRDNDSIGPMEVYQLQPYTFMDLKALIITNTQSQQYKVPRVLRNKQHLEFVWNQRL